MSHDFSSTCSLLKEDCAKSSQKSGVLHFLKEHTPHDAGAQIPPFLRPAISSLIDLLGQKRHAFLVRAGGTKTTFKYQQVIKEAQNYCEEFIEAMDQKTSDILLCTAGNFAGIKHGKSGELAVEASMAFLFNLLPIPAGVIPLSLHRKDEEKLRRSNFNNALTKNFEKSLKGTASLPAGVQFAAKPFDDEIILEIMQELDTLLNESEYPFSQPK